MSPETTKGDLSAIGEPAPPSSDSDPKAEEEKRSLDQAKDELALTGLAQDISQRKIYAGRIFKLVAAWLGVIAFIVILDGLTFPRLLSCFSFDLADSVLIALITTTTGSVVGILLIVTRYLFPRR